jgi:GH25 family lysozyme M1 (1,4-beta-N-acetylmuramidase)
MVGRLIDVSSDQHPNGALIDWKQVAAAGVTGVFIKATQGTDYLNPFFHVDLLGALAAGLKVVAYHFADMGNPIAEAQYFAEQAGDGARMLDYETNTNVPWARAFLQTLGLPPSEVITYGSQSSLVQFYAQLPSMAFPAAYGQGWPGWGVCWQFTDVATIPGIVGNVDEDSWRGDESQYETLFDTYNQPPTPQEAENVTYWEDSGQRHLAGTVNGKAYHWWQDITGPPTRGWNVETLPTP